MPVAIIYTKSGGGKTVNSTRVPGTKLLLDSDNSSVVLNNFQRPGLEVHTTVIPGAGRSAEEIRPLQIVQQFSAAGAGDVFPVEGEKRVLTHTCASFPNSSSGMQLFRQ